MRAEPRAFRPSFPAVLFEVTSECNLDCLYCYNVHKRPQGGCRSVGSYETARATLARLFEIADVGRVTMSGGEPFLAERFDEIVSFCLEDGKEVLITSNGNGATWERYKKFLDMGVAAFVFPLHSVNPEEHDEMTGVKGSQLRSLGSLEYVHSLGATATPIIVVTRINRHSVEETMLFLKRRGFRRIIINRFNFGGRGIKEAGRLALSIAELQETFHSVNDMAVKCGLWVSSNICTPHCVLNPKEYPRIGFGVCDLNLDNRPITLECNGDVRFCNHSPVVMGNIFRDEWTDILSTDYAQRWRDSVPKRCSKCDLWSDCAGGCRAAAEQLGFDMQEVDPIAWRGTDPMKTAIC